MGSVSLDSRQVFSEFIGFLAGERLLWNVIDYMAKSHSAVLSGTDYDSLIWFRGFLILEYAEASYSECLNLVSDLFAWGETSEGHTFWHSIHLKWASIFRVLYPSELYASPEERLFV